MAIVALETSAMLTCGKTQPRILAASYRSRVSDFSFCNLRLYLEKKMDYSLWEVAQYLGMYGM